MAGMPPVGVEDAGAQRPLYRPTQLLYWAHAWASREVQQAEQALISAQNAIDGCTETLARVDAVWGNSFEHIRSIYPHLHVSSDHGLRERSTLAIKPHLDALCATLEGLEGYDTILDRLKVPRDTCEKEYLSPRSAVTWTLKYIGIMRELKEHVTGLRQTMERNLRNAQATQRIAHETLDNLNGAPERLANAYEQTTRVWEHVIHMGDHPEELAATMTQIREIVAGQVDVDGEAGLLPALGEWECQLLSLILPPEIMQTYSHWYSSVDWESSARMQRMLETHATTASKLSEKEQDLEEQRQRLLSRTEQTALFRGDVVHLEGLVVEGEERLKEAWKEDRKAMVKIAAATGGLALTIGLLAAPVTIPTGIGLVIAFGGDMSIAVVAGGVNKMIDDEG